MVAVQLHDRLARLHGIARPLQEADDPAFGGGGESGKVFGHRLAAAQAGNPFRQRALGGRLHANADVRPLLLSPSFAAACRQPVTPEEAIAVRQFASRKAFGREAGTSLSPGATGDVFFRLDTPFASSGTCHPGCLICLNSYSALSPAARRI